MAVTYGFYDSLNHDRLYNAQQMSAIFDGIINDGVFMSVGNQFHTVAGTGMQVIVKSGRAWFDSTWTLNDAEYPLSIDAADVLLTRIDAVVLEVNSEVATRANTIKVVKGTPASTPAKPTLTNTATIHQHALAYVTVAKNITAITNSMIEIVVGKTETPYVTAILQTTDITDLFKKWENDFQVWFETVRSTLEGDIALNLQNQIDALTRSILKDDTKTAMGLPTTAVGDDAFKYLLNIFSSFDYVLQTDDVSNIPNIKYKIIGNNLATIESGPLTSGKPYTFHILIYSLTPFTQVKKYTYTLTNGTSDYSSMRMVYDFFTGDFAVYSRLQNSGPSHNYDKIYYFKYNSSTDSFGEPIVRSVPQIDYIGEIFGLVKGNILLYAGRNYNYTYFYNIVNDSIDSSSHVLLNLVGLGLYHHKIENITDLSGLYNPKNDYIYILAYPSSGSTPGYYPYKVNLTNGNIDKYTSNYVNNDLFGIFYGSIDSYIFGFGIINNSTIKFTVYNLDTNTYDTTTVIEMPNGNYSGDYMCTPVKNDDHQVAFYITTNRLHKVVIDIQTIPTVVSITDITNSLYKNMDGFMKGAGVNPAYRCIYVDNRAMISKKYTSFIGYMSDDNISTSTSVGMKRFKFLSDKDGHVYHFNDLSIYEPIIISTENTLTYYEKVGSYLYKYKAFKYYKGE